MEPESDPLVLSKLSGKEKGLRWDGIPSCTLGGEWALRTTHVKPAKSHKKEGQTLLQQVTRCSVPLHMVP